jgi:hypothetical protein
MHFLIDMKPTNPVQSFFAHEVVIILHHTIHGAYEHLLVHPKQVLEFLVRMGSIVNKKVSLKHQSTRHSMSVLFLPLPNLGTSTQGIKQHLVVVKEDDK